MWFDLRENDRENTYLKEIKDIEDKKVLKVVQDRQRVRGKKREIENQKAR